MTDIELSAATALLIHEAARMNADVVKYGELQSRPDYEAALAVRNELFRRGLVEQHPDLLPHSVTS